MIFAFVFGACIGSFLAFLYERFIYKKDFLVFRSKCLNCDKKLKFYMLIPILSFIFLKGKCAYCKKNIAFCNFLFELVCAFLFLLSYILSENLFDFLILSFLLSNLFLLSMIDIRLFAVPQILLWINVVLSFLYGFDVKNLYYFLLFEEFKSSFVLNFFIFAGMIFILKSFILFLMNLNKKDEILENLGDADILIIACIGSILGFKFGILSIFLASILTLPFFYKFKKLPFIPFLNLAFILVLIFRNFYEISL